MCNRLDKYEKYVKERSEAFELSSEYHPGLNRNGSSNSKQLGEVANTKKTKSSRGVEALKKVNIKGMKKMVSGSFLIRYLKILYLYCPFYFFDILKD